MSDTRAEERYYITPEGEREMMARGESDLGQVLIAISNHAGAEGIAVRDITYIFSTTAEEAIEDPSWAVGVAQHQKIVEDPYYYLCSALMSGFIAMRQA